MDKFSLGGRRILVVEDEPILRMDLCEEIEACGGVVVGPASTLAGGHALLQTEAKPDGGILNIRIGRELVYPLADELISAGIPIIFASSEGRASIPVDYAGIPLLSKPINMMLVAEQLFPASQHSRHG